MSITVLYFASLRDAAGMASESVEQPRSLEALYDELARRHGFQLGRDRLRVAVNGVFADWRSVVPDDAEVAFIPPVSGG